MHTDRSLPFVLLALVVLAAGPAGAVGAAAGVDAGDLTRSDDATSTVTGDVSDSSLDDADDDPGDDLNDTDDWLGDDDLNDTDDGLGGDDFNDTDDGLGDEGETGDGESVDDDPLDPASDTTAVRGTVDGDTSVDGTALDEQPLDGVTLVDEGTGDTLSGVEDGLDESAPLDESLDGPLDSPEASDDSTGPDSDTAAGNGTGSRADREGGDAATDENDDDGAAGGITDRGPLRSISSRDLGTGAAVGGLLAGIALALRRLGTPIAFSGGGGSMLSAALSALRTWLVRLLAVVGYQRYSDDDPLEHDRRQRLYDAVVESPGAYLAEISDSADVPLQTARYHMRILEFENLVTRRTIRGRRRYVPVGTDDAELAAALNDEATAAVIDALATEGSASVSTLAERLDRDPSTVTHHLDRLESDGLVERERDGRAVVNRLADDVAKRLRVEEGATADPAPEEPTPDPQATGGAD